MFKLNIDVFFVYEFVCMVLCSFIINMIKLEIWYVRLGYVYYKRLKDMLKIIMIFFFDINIEKCKICMLIKIIRKFFKDVKSEIKVLDFIYSDLCDLYVILLLGYKKYFVIFIDDVLRYCYVYLLNIKDEVFDKFKIYKKEVEFY